MKKIIDGKRYDTETAECVYRWDNGHYPSDFRYRYKFLYRTKNGAWFIHHEGGALTDMAQPCGSNSTCGSEALEAISAEDAYEFLEANSGETDAQEAIEQYFADRVQEG
jgi:hypothetical protein